MFSIGIQSDGTVTDLTNTELYQCIDIQGLGLPSAAVNTSMLGLMVGEQYNSTKVQPRNIVMTFNLKNDIEAARNALYALFPIGEGITLALSNTAHSVTIDGYVETFNVDLFAERQEVQVSMICPDPYFKDGVVVTASAALNSVVTLDNPGSEIGFIFNASLGDNTGTAIELKFYDDSTKYMRIEFNFTQGDTLTIDTRFGKKSISAHHQIATVNLLSYLTEGSTWLMLPGYAETQLSVSLIGASNDHGGGSFSFYPQRGGI